MSEQASNKFKIFNDPVYGFINVPDAYVFDVLEHPYFQRLRRIRQLGLTHLVYPGALHTRFHHALGAMYLMDQAIETLKTKGHSISEEEKKGAILAILLHDIGHGPFSHALENTLVQDLDHEDFSRLFMEKLKPLHPEGISMALEMFNNTYHRRFFHHLVSGQLDMDRLDYLNRDSFFTGVSEGVVSYDRIIKTLNLAEGKLVTDEKGIYSLEKFVIARRLMYWQVYLHKTVISAEQLLITILQRAKQVAMQGQELFATPALKEFLKKNYTHQDFLSNPHLLDTFALLDDYDIFASVKVWANHTDKVLALLCQRMVARKLFRIELQKEEFETNYIDEIKSRTADLFGLKESEVDYFVIMGKTENNAYDPGVGNIWILQKNGQVSDMAEISDQLNIRVLSNPVKKFYIAYPKEIWGKA